MASERRTCKTKTCHTQFSRPLGSRRVYCEKCRPPRDRQAPLPVIPTPDVLRQPGELEVAVRAELVRTERLESWRGAAAVRLARECDTATGSQVSSLIKQLEAAMAAALDGVPPEPDFVDEMAERRQAKRT